MTLFININLYHPKGNNSGEISTVAADGTVTPFASGLSGPKAIAFAPDGTLYAVGIGEISTVNADGTVATFVSASGIFSFGIAFAHNGALYITDFFSEEILVIKDFEIPSPTISVDNNPICSNGSNPETATFIVNNGDSAPSGFSYQWTLNGNDIVGATGTILSGQNNAGNYSVYITDGNCITEATAGIDLAVNTCMFPACGYVPTVTVFASGLSGPYEVSFTPDGTAMYVTEFDSNEITTVDANGSTYPYVTSGLSGPTGIAFDLNGIMYVTEFINSGEISAIAANGAVTSFANGLVSPFKIAFSPNGTMYVTEFNSGEISTVAANGMITTFASGLSGPAGIAFSPNGTMYVTEFNSGEISTVTANGTVTTFASGLSGPAGIAFDTDGTLYVAEYFSGEISTVAANGTVTTFVSGLSGPIGIAFAPDGILYVAEYFSGEISAISTSEIPAPTITVDNNFICSNGLYPETATFTVNNGNPAPVEFNYQWTLNGNIINGATGATLSEQSTAGNYSVYVTNGTCATEAITGIDLIVTTCIPPACEITPTINTFSSGFAVPTGIAFAPDGTLYIADNDVGTISSIAVDGTATTFASGLSGPVGVAFAPDGTLYVTELSSGAISTITVNGIVTTFASGFIFPTGIAFAPDGTLYVADNDAGVINTVATNGIVSTFVSEFIGNPYGIAFAPDGTLYVVENSSGTISKIAADGTVTTFADGFTNPTGIAFAPNGTLYVVENSSGTITTVAANGTVSTFSSGLSYPYGIAFAPDGTLYITESGSGEISTITSLVPSPVIAINNNPICSNGIAPETATFIVNNGSSAPSGFNYQWTLNGNDIVGATGTILSGQNNTGNYSVYITDGNCITEATAGIDLTLNICTPPTCESPTISTFASGLSLPDVGIAFAPDGTLYVAEYGSGEISTVAANGTVTTFASGLSGPVGIAFASDGTLYVTEWASGQISTVAANGTVSTFVSGLSSPAGIAFAPDGTLYVAEYFSGQISTVAANGTVTTFVSGLSGTYGSVAFAPDGTMYIAEFGSGEINIVTADGTVTTFVSGLLYPSGISFAPDGTMYMVESGLGKINIVAANGTVSTFAQGFSFPIGITFASDGTIYVTEYGSGEISTITDTTSFLLPTPVIVVDNNPICSNGVIPETATFTVNNGSPAPAGFNYQWTLDGNNIVGGTGATLSGQSNAGNYSVYITDGNCITEAIAGIDLTLNICTPPACEAPIIYAFASGLSNPRGIAFAPDGTLYVTEQGTGEISTVAADGTVTTFASGFIFPLGIAFAPDGTLYMVEITGEIITVAADGTVTTFASGLSNPIGVAFAPDGTLYVAEYVSGEIITVAADGTVTTFASGLSNPIGIAFAPDGTLYVIEQGTGEISTVAADGTVTTFASGLSNPREIAFAADGTLYVTEQGTGEISTVAADGTVTPFASGLSGPSGIAFATDGTLYVTESGSGEISTISFFIPASAITVDNNPICSNGVYPETATFSVNNGTPAPAGFNYQWTLDGNDIAGGTGATLSGQSNAGNYSVYITDGNCIKEAAAGIDLILNTCPLPACETPIITTFASGGLSGPIGIAFAPDSTLYVAEYGSGQISTVAADGTVTTFASGLSGPIQIAFAPDGTMYIIEDYSNEISTVAADGTVTTFASGLSGPIGIAFAPDGTMYITENYSNEISTVAADGTVTTFASGLSGYDIVFAPDGTLYVAEYFSGQISTVAANGTVTTFASGLSNPREIAFAADGTLYVTEQGTGEISTVAADGTVTTFASGLSYPTGIAFAPDGTIYVTEQQSTRKISTITVFKIPVITVDSNPICSNGVAPETATFTANNGDPAPTGSNYQWTLNGNDITGQTEATLSGQSTSGTYSVYISYGSCALQALTGIDLIAQVCPTCEISSFDTGASAIQCGNTGTYGIEVFWTDGPDATVSFSDANATIIGDNPAIDANGIATFIYPIGTSADISIVDSDGLCNLPNLSFSNSQVFNAIDYATLKGNCSTPPQITLPNGYSCIYEYLTGGLFAGTTGSGNIASYPTAITDGDSGTVRFTITTPCGNTETIDVNFICLACNANTGTWVK